MLHILTGVNVNWMIMAQQGTTKSTPEKICLPLNWQIKDKISQNNSSGMKLSICTSC